MTRYLPGFFFFLILLVSCTHDSATPSGSMSLDDKAQLMGTLDFQSVVYKDGEGGFNCFVSSNFNNHVTDTIESSYLFSFEKGDFVQQEAVVLLFLNVIPHATTVDTTFDSFKKMFRPGLYPFLAISNLMAGKSLAIEYFDRQQKTWLSMSGPQTNSTFSIASVEESTFHSSKAIKIKAIFSCTLYNTDGLSMPFSGSVQFYLVKPFV